MSRVTSMSQMFMSAASFNGDISKWDVSSVNTMSRMFMSATSFNADLSNWDVSSVTSMDDMFFEATSFTQKLCGSKWIDSKASQKEMFKGSSGSISQAPCAATAIVTAFSSKAEFRDAVKACLKSSPGGECSDGSHGSITDWDVSRVTDMSDAFATAKHFTGDLSKWDVSSVTSMFRMFKRATSFNGDVSRWDLSRVTSMSQMFMSAASFNLSLIHIS